MPPQYIVAVLVLIGSLVMDHYGIVGYSVRSISTGRVAGAVLLLVGVLLINRG